MIKGSEYLSSNRNEARRSLHLGNRLEVLRCPFTIIAHLIDHLANKGSHIKERIGCIVNMKRGEIQAQYSPVPSELRSPSGCRPLETCEPFEKGIESKNWTDGTLGVPLNTMCWERDNVRTWWVVVPCQQPICNTHHVTEQRSESFLSAFGIELSEKRWTDFSKKTCTESVVHGRVITTA